MMQLEGRGLAGREMGTRKGVKLEKRGKMIIFEG